MSFGEIPECNHGGPIRTKELKISTDGQIKVECMYNPAEYTDAEYAEFFFLKNFYRLGLVGSVWSGRDKNQHLSI